MAYQSTQALPNDVAQIAATNHLGPFSAAYRASRNSEAIVGGCLIVVAGMLSITFFSLLRYGVPIPWWVGILLVVGAFLIGSLGFGMYGTLGGVSAAYLFENGIVYSQKRQLTALLWSQIASCEMRQGSNAGYRERCIVRTKDGRAIPFGNFARYEELGTSIKNAVEPHEMGRES